MPKLVSVVVPTYNYRHYVGEAIESVLAQSHQPLEILVVDDGSTDGTQEELRRFNGRIRYLHQPNRGLSAARNTGILAAAGEFIALLDADDLWAPTKIEKQMALMDSPEVGVVFCALNRIDVRSGAEEVKHCLPDSRGDLRRMLLHRNCMTASTVLVRRACFEKAGLFDESLRSAEDWDMWIRISRHFHFDYVPEPLITYRIHGANMTKKIATMHQYQMQVLRRAFDEDPIAAADRLLRRRGLAYVHFDAGDEYFAAGDYRAARRHLLRSVVLWPFSYRHCSYLARTVIRRAFEGPEG